MKTHQQELYLIIILLKNDFGFSYLVFRKWDKMQHFLDFFSKETVYDRSASVNISLSDLTSISWPKQIT